MTFSLRRKRPTTVPARNTPSRTAYSLAGLLAAVLGGTAFAQGPSLELKFQSSKPQKIVQVAAVDPVKMPIVMKTAAPAVPEEPLSSTDAIRVAHDAAADPAVGGSDSHGISMGEKVIVSATDTGTEPIEGTLYGAAKNRISIAREDPRAGKVVVHFPRLGFELRRAK